MRPATNSPTAAPTSAHPRRVIIASEPAARSGTGTDSRIDASTSAALTPRVIASDDSTSRCSSTAGASSFTSSGTTYERPMLAASARAARCNPSAPRGLTPSRRSR